MTDELIERARTGFAIAAMKIERDVRLHHLSDDEERSLVGAALEAAGVSSLVESAYREGHARGRVDGSALEEDADWEASNARAVLSKGDGG